MHLFITGATGFLGRRILRQAVAAGHRITVGSRDPRAAARALASLAPAAKFLRLDPADSAPLVRALRNGPPDAVIHAAAILKGTRRELQAVNVDGTAALARAVASLKPPPRFVLVSSFAVDDEPGAPYAESKRGAEAAVRDAGVPWVIVRPALLYGRDDPGATAALVQRVAAGTMWLPGGGRALIQPVHVDDVAAACLAAATEPAAEGRLYRLGGPEPVSIAAFREAVRDATGGAARVRSVPRLLFGLAAWALRLAGRGGPAAVHAYHGRDHLVDIRDARRDLGFQPRPLARGIVETFGPDGQGGRHAPGC